VLIESLVSLKGRWLRLILATRQSIEERLSWATGKAAELWITGNK
jgi:hypothetical protein